MERALHAAAGPEGCVLSAHGRAEPCASHLQEDQDDEQGRHEDLCKRKE